MKAYPSIEYPKESDYGQYCYAFLKYDGSNLRFEWHRKRGWWKFGTRTRLFDRSDPDFGIAIDLFLQTYGDLVIEAIRHHKLYRNADNLIVYCEFFGANSFAGQHIKTEPKQLVMFDVNIHKRGILGPKEFLEVFGNLHVAQEVYRGFFTKEFEKEVWEGKYPVVEGVIIKGDSGHRLWMRKIKTTAYKERLKQFFKQDWEKYW